MPNYNPETFQKELDTRSYFLQKTVNNNSYYVGLVQVQIFLSDMRNLYQKVNNSDLSKEEKSSFKSIIDREYGYWHARTRDVHQVFPSCFAGKILD